MIKFRHFLIITIMAVFVVISTSAYGAIPSTERAALIALYNSTDGDNWTDNSGWKAPPLHSDGFAMPGTEGSWQGIKVSKENDHVSSINFDNNLLNGSIPPELGGLSGLTRLILTSNQLTGLIPPELGGLSGLTHLILTSNQLTGPIPPELGNLSNLLQLYLYINQLSGPIPSELGNLSNLINLGLRANQLTGSIPSELGNLSNLTYLGLSHNQLTGSIPSELGNLSNLRFLDLSDNQLTGPIPFQFGSLFGLTYFYLSINQLTGSIPSQLGNLTNLTHFYLYRNELSGSIPPVLGNLSNLVDLRLYRNQLSGNIPETITNLTALNDNGGISICDNSLYTDDSIIRNFLNQKHDGDWESCQNEIVLQVYYRDSDNDGFGDPTNSTESNSQPSGYVLDNTDCDDTNANIHPGITEYCNDIDDDCNNLIDDECILTCNFPPDKIILNTPSTTIEDTTITFVWNENFCAGWYKLYLENTATDYKFVQWYEIEDDYSNYPEVECSGGICSVTLNYDLEIGDYEWWVRGWNENGNGPWSDGLSFTIQGNDAPPSKVTHTSPSGTTQDSTPTFTWIADPDSTWYKLWIGYPNGDRIFGEWYDAANICSGSICSVTPDLELTGGDYEWYIKSWNDYGKIWSDGMSLSMQGNISTDEYFVATTGNDNTGNGFINSPYRTIQHALDQATPGATITLRNGTYDESIRIRKANTTVRSYPGEWAVIQAPINDEETSTTVTFDTDSDGSQLQRVEVIGGYWYGIKFNTKWDWGDENDRTGASNIIIEDCKIHDTGNACIKVTPGCDDITIRRCEIYNSGRIRSESAEAIDNVNGDRMTVKQCNIHDITATGLYAKGGSIGTTIERCLVKNCGGAGILLGFDTSPEFFDTTVNPNYYENISGTVTNCVVVNTQYAGIGLYAAKDAKVINNTLVDVAQSGHAGLFFGITYQDWDDTALRPPSINPTIKNNILTQSAASNATVIEIRYDDELGGLSGLSGMPSMFNNQYFVHNGTAFFEDNRPNNEFSGNLMQWKEHISGDADSAEGDPQFISAVNENYQLSSTSPCRDAGISDGAPVIDYEGSPRPQSGVDIGAYELAETITLEGGYVTYTYNGQVYRIQAMQNAVTENISQALESLSPLPSGGEDSNLNISPDGNWLILETERFDEDCVGWACMAVVSSDLSTGDVIRVDGSVLRQENFPVIASGGNLVIYSTEGTHELDLWTVSRSDSNGAWATPVELTGSSPYNMNYQPAISSDGTKVIFNCTNETYSGAGNICEVGTNGQGFRVVLTPTDSPGNLPDTADLNYPDYAPDGSIIFEADWSGEQLWRLLTGATEPVRVTDTFGNDNSPCILSDGRIVSLWLNRSGGQGYHEIKVMNSDGSSYYMLLTDIDVLDIGMGCGN